MGLPGQGSVFAPSLAVAQKRVVEAAMDIPSPPFSSYRDCIRNRQSLQKKIVV